MSSVKKKRISFPVIESATQGDLDAIRHIVQHYSHMIYAKTRNEFVRMEMEDELIRGILKFQIRIG